jgi:hypothetical protein|tara:strand:+ start:576 stop:1733 length:1158 start_codon:yes stop_codon:yes gene_type:complete
LSKVDWENVLDIASSIPASGANACADQALDTLRVWHKDLLPGVAGRDLLWERAAELNLLPNGQTSANGSCRIMAVGDDWLGLNLARNEDWELLNAWLEQDDDLSNWAHIEKALLVRDAQVLLARARSMGLAASRLSEKNLAESAGASELLDQPPWFEFTSAAKTAPQSLNTAKALSELQVVDLSALWAGPLCAHLLHQFGMQVTTVSSIRRPDGAQQGSPKLYEVLHRGHAHVELDFTSQADLKILANLLRNADVVIEGSRPRALRALGVDRDTLGLQGKQLWLSLTAYGRTAPCGDWVGFGDDVALAGGLFATAANGRAEFIADAVADPLTGIFAASAVVTLLRHGASGLLDLSLFSVARHCYKKIHHSGAQVSHEYHRPNLRC